MQLGSGYTVEEQVTKKAVFGGIQLDVVPRRAEPPSGAFKDPNTSVVFSVDKTPQELGLKPNGTISFDPWRTRITSNQYTSKGGPWSLEGYRRRTGSLTLTAYYHVPSFSQRGQAPWPSGTFGMMSAQMAPRSIPMQMAQSMPMSMASPQMYGMVPPAPIIISGNFSMTSSSSRDRGSAVARERSTGGRMGLAAGGAM